MYVLKVEIAIFTNVFLNYGKTERLTTESRALNALQ
jgi:hypothetical protein